MAGRLIEVITSQNKQNENHRNLLLIIAYPSRFFLSGHNYILKTGSKERFICWRSKPEQFVQAIDQTDEKNSEK
jgi:hypothetical protein